MSLKQDNEAARELLRRLYNWDHMDTAGDGAYWRGEIDKVLRRYPPPERYRREAPTGN